MTGRPRYVLQGHFPSFKPEIVLQFLSWSQADGVLVAKNKNTIVRVFFSAGRIVYAAAGVTVVDFGSDLVQAGLVTPEAFEQAAREAEQLNDTGVVSCLLASDQLEQERLDGFVRERVFATLTQLLPMQVGRFTFQLESGVPGLQGSTFRSELDNLLLECWTRLERSKRDGDVADGV